ncbi:type II toxin-antitoxin system VapC family toxin [Arcicella sp. DC2W]|uniref:Type II toxin-antitoxin system VapC family toxin n=1 Tax=Arcicella gelida TaxID=2984195 RepID=A0ABU5S9K2_9BACT|nr:type II toxin-antitoxin system VapC family toxin [Arcicella sp. DC2W]MEA5405156.1 type II toxin-antitoxin system VapC family toxin [Arcicella sp. DC2W]
MNYLLDTNIFIILLLGQNEKLSKKQQSILKESNNTFFLSEASLYEIAIKVRLDKANFSAINMNVINEQRKNLKIKLIPSKEEFYYNIPNVPKVYISKSKPHGDPFDLLIISQALLENIPILSTDDFFPSYEGLNVIS